MAGEGRVIGAGSGKAERGVISDEAAAIKAKGRHFRASCAFGALKGEVARVGAQMARKQCENSSGAPKRRRHRDLTAKWEIQP